MDDKNTENRKTDSKDAKERISEEEIENIVFSSIYKRKISIKDFLFTKQGFLILCFIALCKYFEILNGWTMGLSMTLMLYFYSKQHLLKHEKEEQVWIYKLKKIFFERLENESKKYRKRKVSPKRLKKTIEECSIK